MKLLEIKSISSPIKELDKIAAERFGSFGFADLEEDQAARLIYIERANKIAEKEFGEFGLMSCNATEIAQIINANPSLIKKVNEEELESKTAEDLWSENSSSASKYISTATYQVRPIKDSKPVKYEAFSVISTTRKPYGTFTADELNAALKPIRPNQTPDAEGFTTYIDPVKVDAFQYSGDPVKVDLGKGDIQTADDSDYIVRTVDGNNFVYRIEEAGDFEAGLKKA
jgi:hypothetical protein